ncbi:Rrf2 family transcriptional regulator [Rhizobium bangladeshense]|uniref:Rrf2 family transcriptional regulator n=1 Tax=Rhizobium bangladeshense TaxID=1138189 RepID=UPI001C83B420|nr:Rrf2 family transcriptional regulator [Rhizobium bangladeshense]MBX4903596.1 Rrf2 family transcriptional regulator [Rhizobium bangladeshense]MBX4915128.1 Rrf2 family transcriptional regulator [Rhizobium bangladeshense]
MRNDSRLSRMLHVLIHMDRHEHSATSEMIAKMLNTNPVVVRRTMAGLRQQGYVRSEKGHGGGWTLVRPLSEITLLDVYNALGDPHVFAIGPADDQPECLVEQAVNNALADAMKEAEALLLKRLGSVTLEEIAAEFEAKLTARSATTYSCAS